MTITLADLAFSNKSNQCFILRFWNVLNRNVQGSLKQPPGWLGAEICDALERSVKPLDATEDIIRFSAKPLEILTIALAKGG